MGWTFNPFTDNLDATGSGVVSIPEYTTDPSSPLINSAWILKTAVGGGIPDGTPMGMLLALTYTGNSAGGGTTYQLSYMTAEGTTIRTSLS